MQKLIIKENNQKEERNINDLLEVLKEYGSLFLPSGDDLALDIYYEEDYYELIKGFDFYYSGDYLKGAIKYMSLLDEFNKMNDLDSLIGKLDEFNEAFKLCNINISYTIS